MGQRLASGLSDICFVFYLWRTLTEALFLLVSRFTEQ
jgi:hypothetical protein